MQLDQEGRHQINQASKTEWKFDRLGQKAIDLVGSVDRNRDRREKEVEKRYPNGFDTTEELVPYLSNDKFGQEEFQDCVHTFIALQMAGEVRKYLDDTGPIPHFNRRGLRSTFKMLNSRYAADVYVRSVLEDNAFTEIPENTARLDEIATMSLPLRPDNRWQIDRNFTGANAADELHAASLFGYLLRHTPEELTECVASTLAKDYGHYTEAIAKKILALRERAVAYVESYQALAVQDPTKAEEKLLQVQQALGIVGTSLFPTSIGDLLPQMPSEVGLQLRQSVGKRYEVDHARLMDETDAANANVYKDALSTYKNNTASVIFAELESAFQRRDQVTVQPDVQTHLLDQPSFEVCRDFARAYITHIGDIGDINVELSAQTPGVIDILLVAPNADYEIDGYDHTVVLQITPDGKVLGISPEHKQKADAWLAKVQELVRSVVDAQPRRPRRDVAPVSVAKAPSPAVNVGPVARLVRPVAPTPPRAPKRKTNGIPRQQVDVLVAQPESEVVQKKHNVYPTTRYLRLRDGYANDSAMLKAIDDAIQAIKDGTALIRPTAKRMKDVDIVGRCVNLPYSHRLLLVEGDSPTDLFILGVSNHEDYETALRNFRKIIRDIDFANPPVAL